MRTNYPTPSFAIRYDYQLVDSTFIHAVHFAVTKGSYNSTLGISLQSDPDTILWYILKDPGAVWRRITDPKQSPGFVYNNSIRGKQYTKQEVVDKTPFIQCDKPNGPGRIYPKPLSSYLEAPKKHVCCGGKNCQVEGKTVVKNGVAQLEFETKISTTQPTSFSPVQLKEKAPATVHVNPKGSGVAVNEYNGYGPLLDVCNRTSSCLGYLALGFNRVTKGLVIYYAIKNNNDVYALQTNDATLYQEWIKAESLGRYFNRSIKRLGAVNVRRAAKA